MRRLIPFLFCAVSTLKVVSDPYSGIHYGKINSYEIENVYLEDCINVTLGDGFDDELVVVEDDEEETGPEPVYFVPPQEIKPWWK